MGMGICLLSVIVNQLNIKGVSILKPEDDAPIRAHRNRPVSFPITLELVQPIARQIKSLGRGRNIEDRQDLLYRINQIRTDSAPVSLLIKPFQSSTVKAPGSSGYCTLTIVACLYE